SSTADQPRAMTDASQPEVVARCVLLPPDKRWCGAGLPGGGSSCCLGFAFESVFSVGVVGCRSGVPSVRLGVVGEDCAAAPGALPLAAVQAAALESVAAFGVRGPAFGAGAVAREPPPRPFRAG